MRVKLALLFALSAVALSGCGIGPGAAPTAVQVVVTRDFGSQVLHQAGGLKVAGQETVMSLLMRNYKVATKYGGGFVQSIDGLAGGQEAGEPVDWFYYVNGVEAPKGAAATNVEAGDHIWWDHHDWSQSENIPAVVGSFPEPFLNGIAGKRLPVRVECTDADHSACQTVSDRLDALKVPAAIAAVGSGGAPETLRVLVGSWHEVGEDLDAPNIAEGPRVSGVYVRISDAGSKLTLLNENGQPAQTLGAGAGLIAATGLDKAKEGPVWVVTGTNLAGVDLAARDFNQATLENRFAVALTPEGAALPLPVLGK
jgi:Domain of unknown function (DUF4430)